MKATTNRQGLILPLNVSDPRDRATAFNAIARAKLIMAIYTYRGAPKYDEGEADEFRSTVAQAVEAFEQFGGTGVQQVRVIELAHARDTLLAHGISEAVSGNPNTCHCYPMVAFYDRQLVDPYPAYVFEPHHGLHAGMSFLDDQYLLTKSLDPSAHKPFQIEEAFARTFRLVVGGVFQERVGWWCRTLAEPRARFMVMYYALEHGRDPVAEWQKFVSAGGKHHFDYLNLFP
jgi:hypothetical protein